MATISIRRVPRFSRTVESAADRISLRETICRRTAAAIVNHFGSAIRSIILTGSLARDEASFLLEGGAWKLIGDAEFLVVFDTDVRLPDAAETHSLCREIELDLRARGIDGLLSIAMAHSDYLAGMPPHIYGYELLVRGRVVCGEWPALSLIPTFTPEEIPLEDGWRMLCNRIVEQIEVSARISRGQAKLEEEGYARTVKLCLDMATSFLLFMHCYEPSYRARQVAVCRLAARHGHRAHLGFFLSRFAALVSEATEWKLNPHPVEPQAARWLWIAATGFARALLRWEMLVLTGSPDSASNRVLWTRISRREPLHRRLRGWFVVCREEGWLRSRRSWPRWMRLALQGSPRSCVYREAADLFAFLPPSFPAFTGEAPAVGMSPGRLPVETDASGDWTQWARQIAWNYHHFLEKTRT